MIRPINITLNAAHPELPLQEATTFTGSPSTVFVRGVPKAVGNWTITAVQVAVSYPDNTATSREAVESAEGVWVATIPGTATSGRTEAGFRILASGVDENGAAVTGYVLGFADFSVFSLIPLPTPDAPYYYLRYFESVPASPHKGDVCYLDGVLKWYDGSAWQPIAGAPVVAPSTDPADAGKSADAYATGTALAARYTKQETDDAIDALAAYYITYNAQGANFPTRAALLNATAYYSGGALRVPTRNDYAVVLADEAHDGAEWRYIYAVPDGSTTGQWEAQYPIETNDYTALSNKPQINGHTLTGNKTAAQLGLADAETVDSLLFAEYYPDGSVKSATDFTAGIKYNNPDTVNRTITVKPFCNQYGTAENDNSNLSGRVVIPPFVDASGNPYISNDGMRFKVVGVSEGVPYDDNTNLTAIIVPNTMTTIGYGAFFGCSSLTSVYLPAATNISEYAFSRCSSLTSVTLPAVTNIGHSAFGGCSSLTSVYLPAATNISEYAFNNCDALASVDFGNTLRPSVPTLGEDAFNGVPTSCKIIVPYTQYDEWVAADGWKDLPQDFVRHAEKADKPATFTAGNLAKFDANGNPTDSTIPAANVALTSQLRYAFNTATVSTGTTPTVTNLADRASNTATLGSTVTAATVTLPAATPGKMRDFYIRLIIQSSDAPTITFYDPATSATVTSANITFGASSLADIAPGDNVVLFTEIEGNGWLVSVKHEEAS